MSGIINLIHIFVKQTTKQIEIMQVTIKVIKGRSKKYNNKVFTFNNCKNLSNEVICLHNHIANCITRILFTLSSSTSSHSSYSKNMLPRNSTLKILCTLKRCINCHSISTAHFWLVLCWCFNWSEVYGWKRLQVYIK
jgi:hypothetical protein